MVLENEIVYGYSFEVSDTVLDKDYLIPIGKAKVMKEGKDVSIITMGRAVHTALEAVPLAKNEGIDIEVINLRTLRPLDNDTIFKSIKKTHHAITLEQGWPQSCVGSEIISRVMEDETFYHLDAPIWRVTCADIPMPYAIPLEDECIPQTKDVLYAIRKVLGKSK